MKFLATFLFAIFAITYVQATIHCTQERAAICVTKLLQVVWYESDMEEVCSDLQITKDCVEGVVDECLEGREEEMEEVLEDLDELLRDNCEGVEAIRACLEENEEYIYRCGYDISQKPVRGFLEDGLGGLDEDAKTCILYRIITGCFVSRIRAKCGKKAAAMAEAKIEKLEACDKANGFDIDALNQREDKRRT